MAGPAPVTPAAPASPAPPAPGSPGELFRVFTLTALQGFGGVLPAAQHMLVERTRWLTTQQFVEMLSLAQVLPGPNIVNLSLMVGDRFFGLRGALASMAGMICAPLCVVLLLAAAASHWRDQPAVAGALHGMGVVAVGLVVASAIKLAGPLRRNPLGRVAALGIALITVLLVGALRWPLVGVVLGLGGASVAAAWWRLRAAKPAKLQ